MKFGLVLPASPPPGNPRNAYLENGGIAPEQNVAVRRLQTSRKKRSTTAGYMYVYASDARVMCGRRCPCKLRPALRLKLVTAGMRWRRHGSGPTRRYHALQLWRRPPPSRLQPPSRLPPPASHLPYGHHRVGSRGPERPRKAETTTVEVRSTAAAPPHPWPVLPYSCGPAPTVQCLHRQDSWPYRGQTCSTVTPLPNHLPHGHRRCGHARSSLVRTLARRHANRSHPSRHPRSSPHHTYLIRAMHVNSVGWRASGLLGSTPTLITPARLRAAHVATCRPPRCWGACVVPAPAPRHHHPPTHPTQIQVHSAHPHATAPTQQPRARWPAVQSRVPPPMLIAGASLHAPFVFRHHRHAPAHRVRGSLGLGWSRAARESERHPVIYPDIYPTQPRPPPFPLCGRCALLMPHPDCTCCTPPPPSPRRAA